MAVKSSRFKKLQRHRQLHPGAIKINNPSPEQDGSQSSQRGYLKNSDRSTGSLQSIREEDIEIEV